jgi:hypothetical protein
MQNFGKIKNTFNNLLIEGIVKNDENIKKLFKKYIKTIKESEILKTQFLIYSNIENKVDTEQLSAFSFVSENFRLLEKYSQSDILKENKKLLSLLKNFNNKFSDSYDLQDLHESMSKITFTKRSPKNVEPLMVEIKKVSEFINKNKVKEIKETFDLPVSIISKLMVEKYNQKYSDLNEEDKEVIKALISNDNDKKKELYQKEVNECISIIDNLIQVSEGEEKEKLSKVKMKLQENEQELSNDKFLDKISKLMELKNSLK